MNIYVHTHQSSLHIKTTHIQNRSISTIIIILEYDKANCVKSEVVPPDPNTPEFLLPLIQNSPFSNAPPVYQDITELSNVHKLNHVDSEKENSRMQIQ